MTIVGPDPTPLRRAGLSTLPLPYGTKELVGWMGWQRFCREWPSDALMGRWFGDGEPHNIAVLCGSASGGQHATAPVQADGLAVLVFNDRDVYRAFTGERDPRSFTWVASSARGEHVYLRLVGELPSTRYWDTGRGRAGDADHKRVLELRSAGAYVVGVPSRHPSGATYSWLEPRVPSIGVVERAAFDAWLQASLERAARAGRALKRASDDNGPAPPIDGDIEQGARYLSLLSFAGSMRRRGMSRAAIAAALDVENAERCKPPLPADELARIVRDIGGKAPHQLLEGQCRLCGHVWKGAGAPAPRPSVQADLGAYPHRRGQPLGARG
jgi:hypothetical protein